MCTYMSKCVSYLSLTHHPHGQSWPKAQTCVCFCAWDTLLTPQPAKMVSIISWLPHLNSKFINEKPLASLRHFDTCCSTGQQLCSYITSREFRCGRLCRRIVATTRPRHDTSSLLARQHQKFMDFHSPRANPCKVNEKLAEKAEISSVVLYMTASPVYMCMYTAMYLCAADISQCLQK